MCKIALEHKSITQYLRARVSLACLRPTKRIESFALGARNGTYAS